MKKVLFLTVLALISLLANAQNNDSTKIGKLPFVRINYQAGKVLPTNDFVRGENENGEPIDAYHAVALEFGRQTNGEKRWHHLWGMPKVGVGFYTADFFNDEELGQPGAIYGFFNTTIKQWDRFGIHVESAAGMTFNWQPYDAEINPANVAIGSYNTVYIDFGFRAEWKVAKRLQLDLSYTYTHFSNGGTKLPNMGLNLTGPKATIMYHFKGNEPLFQPEPEGDFSKINELVFAFKASTRQVKFDTSITGISTQYLGINYNVYGAEVGFLRHFKERFKYGGGLDVAYDESTTAQLDVVDSVYDPVDTPKEYHWNMSVYATAQMVIGNASFYVDMGYYFWRKEIPGQTPDLYQRFGFRWDVYKGIQIGGGLRVYNYGIADYIEWNVGYRFGLKKK